MIGYFREHLRPFIPAQLDAQGRELDTCKEAGEKAINAEAKTLLQSAPSTHKIDSWCP